MMEVETQGGEADLDDFGKRTLRGGEREEKKKGRL